MDDQTGQIVVEKQPAAADRLADEFLTGLHRLPTSPDRIDSLIHGTTIAINAVVQAHGARVALLTTRGFRDVLAIGRGARPELYNWLYTPPTPLVPRYLRLEIDERIAADGRILRPLDNEQLDHAATVAIARGAETIAVSFLHAYANPEHERRAVDRLRRSYPHIPVTASHELVAEWGEFERTSTVVLNSYIKPLFQNYLRQLTEKLAASGYSRTIAVMQSNGGVTPASRAAELPGAHADVRSHGRRRCLAQACSPAGPPKCDLCGCGRYELRCCRHFRRRHHRATRTVAIWTPSAGRRR